MAPPQDRPPTLPEAWAARDATLGRELRLPAGDKEPVHGKPSCRCGGSWRYLLLPHAHHPLWRCLHCGILHRGDQPLPEDPPLPR